jgi:tetratricopeptide (TPR) repeat protein
MTGHEDPPEVEAETGGAYDRAIDRAFGAVRRWVRTRPAPGRRSERLSTDVVSGRRGWHNLTCADLAALDPLAWVDVWIERCHALRFQDPKGMIRAAESACAAAHGLDTAVYGETKRFDTCALAWAELANAHRVADQLDVAGRTLESAMGFLYAGSGDTLLLARLAEISASLACDQRCFPLAHYAAEWAHSCYLEAGDAHRAGRVLLQRSHFSACDGKPEEALGWLLESVKLLDFRRSPELGPTVVQNAILYSVRAGLFTQAQRLLWTARLYRLLPDEGLNRVRLRAIEGTIWAGLDHLDRAERAFKDAQAGYEDHGLWFQAGIAGLDVAKVWLRQGRDAEVMPLAQELVEAFVDLDIRREAVAALMVLQEACTRRILTLELVDRVAEYLRELEELPATAAAPMMLR